MTTPYMVKFSSNSDFDFGVESTQVVTDLHGLVKRASSRQLLKFAKTANQTDLHVIAVGAYEGTGINRNCDLFKEADCKKNHGYFKRADRAVHRHHKNKKTDPKFGNIKASAYNDKMKRIELIVGLDNDTCGDIIQEQEKVGHTNWSMASKQAHDVCTWCGHKAVTDEDRCAHIPDKLGELNDMGEICAMENPDPNWFEISYVRRPADRIGMSLSKVASENRLRPMLTRDYLQLYTGFEAPADNALFISKKASDKRALLPKLSEMEKFIDGIAQKPAQKQLAKTEKIASDLVDELRKLEPARFFKLSAERGIILSPENFVSYLFGDRVKTAAVTGMKSFLPHIFEEIEKDGEAINSERYEPSNILVASKDEKNLVQKLACSHSLFEPFLKARVANSFSVKTAEQEDQVEATAFDKELAKQYASYKLAALNYLEDNNKLDQQLIYAAVTQNRN